MYYCRKVLCTAAHCENHVSCWSLLLITSFLYCVVHEPVLYEINAASLIYSH